MINVYLLLDRKIVWLRMYRLSKDNRKGIDLPDPTLATKLYYHYKKNYNLGKQPKECKFNIINFVDVEYSRRVNPILPS